jgi:hypothetical protein
MDAAKAVTATFALDNYALAVSKSGTGSGVISSDPPGIACGADCAESYPYGTVVTLTATADTGSAFAVWAGACSGSSPTCQLAITASRSLTATFTSYRIYLPGLSKG